MKHLWNAVKMVILGLGILGIIMGAVYATGIILLAAFGGNPR